MEVSIPREHTDASMAMVACAIAATGLLAAAPAMAQVGYAGKTVEMIVGSDAGNPFDIYSRLIAKYMAKHIPGNPTFITKNLPGAAGNKAAAYIYSIAAKDGLTIGSVSPGSIMGPLTDGSLKAQFEPTRFEYLGSADNAARVCVTYHTSPIKTFDQARTGRVIVGATAGGGASSDYPTLLNAIAGTKFEIVSGYKGVGEYLLAMERGEVDGTCTGWPVFPSTRPDWVRDKKINILMQFGVEAYPEFTRMGVPEVWSYLKNDDDRKMMELMVSQQQFQRPYILPPGTPKDAVEILRTAFDKALIDKDLLAEADKSKLTVNITTGAQVKDLVDRIYATSPALVDRFQKTMAPGK